LLKHRLAIALAICVAAPVCHAQTAPPAAASQAQASISSIRVLGVVPHPEAGISESSIQALADNALREQAAGAAPASLSFAQIQAIADQITQAYRLAGFLVAKAIVPPQQIDAGGTLTIQVVEGRLGQVRVQGSNRYRTSTLAAPMQPLVGQPVQLKSLEQAVLQARALPGVSISPVLAPGANPGETDVILVAQDSGRPYAVRLGASNQGTDTSGRYRLEAGVTLYSPMGVGDLLSASYAYGLNPNDSWVGAAAYSLPFDSARGVTGVVGFSRSELEITTGPFAALELNGPTTQGYTGLDWKFIDRPGLQAQLSGRYIHETARLDGLGQRLSDHTFDVVEAGLAVRHEQAGSRAINFAQLTLRKAVKDGSAEQNLIYNAHDSYFWLARVALSRLQAFTPDQRVSLRANAQFTGSALTPLEQFSIGGPNSVRAAPLSAALGDRGVQGTFEYQIDAPGFAKAASPFAGRSWGEVLTVQAFYDWGRVSPVSQNRRLGVLPITYEGAGVGMELRLPYQQGLQLNLSAAKRTGRTRSPDGDEVQVWAAVGFTF
jgi:hemolysin activation/secretion protein